MANLEYQCYFSGDKTGLNTVILNTTIFENIRGHAWIRNNGNIIICDYDVDHLINILNSYKLNLLWRTPGWYLYILQHPKFKPKLLSSVDHLVVIGEVAPISLQKEIYKQCHKYLIPLYGATEFGVVTAPTETGFFKHPIIGKVVYDNVQTKLIDKDTRNEISDIKTIGELCISSPTMFQGYLPAELDQDSFYDRIFFKTGDLAYIGEDNSYYFVGRIKNIIINKFGDNISIAEVENKLLKIEGLKNVCVVEYRTPEEFSELCAYIVKKENSDINEFSLRKYLSKNIERYEIPKEIVFLDCLPYNKRGKLDRNLLKNLAQKNTLHNS